MSKKARLRSAAFVLVPLLALAAFLAYRWWDGRVVLREDVLANVPASARAIVHVQVPEVRGSALYDEFVVGRGGDFALRALAAECGFDWTEGLRTLTAFTTPARDDEEASELGHIAFLLVGDFDLPAMAECIGQDGELVSEEVLGVQAYRGENDYYGAMLDDGALLVAHRDALEETVRTLRGEAPALASVSELRNNWQQIAPGRHLSAALRLEGPYRAQARRFMAAGLEADDVPAPRVLVAGARVARGLTLGARWSFASEEDAERVEVLAEARRQELRGNVMLALTPVAPALRRLAIERDGDTITSAVDLDAQRVRELIEFLE